jgi:hypothetical protein
MDGNSRPEPSQLRKVLDLLPTIEGLEIVGYAKLLVLCILLIVVYIPQIPA